uniref:uncharacterized protein LOC120332661 isoform X2 n=1 Tax=Styela clava TaxID=7725 RepID=UPI001939D134|nr:uncharacterized protein LOC120332661 isoform X2 [Styela clava]XP_039255893.1 uncharacterized protein LOC120332661 isoform X2 [Styela clava]XP_039255894.1 uncharacterized protein LOC120332661 isoform X2 [Styela clava]XP_039255895.1 uncharacterized protein LOC120332661 isoform X2 [Styela clava]
MNIILMSILLLCLGGVMSTKNVTQSDESQPIKKVDLAINQKHTTRSKSKKSIFSKKKCKKIWKTCECFCARFQKTLNKMSCEEVFKLKWKIGRCWKCRVSCDEYNRVSGGLGG